MCRHQAITWTKVDLLLMGSYEIHLLAISEEMYSIQAINAANTKRDKHVIITSKQRFDVIIMCLLHFLFAGKASLKDKAFQISTTSPMDQWV